MNQARREDLYQSASNGLAGATPLIGAENPEGTGAAQFSLPSNISVS